MKPEFDAAVVGLGAAGSATAWHLAARGLRVLGLDAHAPPHDRGSSHGSLRITRQAIGEGDAYVPLVLRSNEHWRTLEREAGARLLEVTGGLWISSPARQAETHVANFFDNTLAAARRFGIGHELLDANAVRARFPQFAVRDNERAYYEPGAGYLRPEACVAAMLAAARRHGAELHADEPVTRFREEADAIVLSTAGREYRAAALVLCAGPWMPGLVDAPIAALFTVTRQVQYWFALDEPVSRYEAPAFPVWIWELQDRRNVIYGFPAADGAAAGVKIATEQYAHATSPDAMRRDVSAAEVREMSGSLVRPHLPGVSSRCVRTAPCLYTATPDFHFVIDRLPGTARVVLVSACSGHGFKHAPAVGEMAADLVLGWPGALSPAGFTLGRFKR
ncbi:MAG TPA: N-methyl-L-tryptophan oxidase [Usitatibacter sp.]|nr:N-methyl-L-tryptophan oxidase [Usitatibacter sp.]